MNYTHSLTIPNGQYISVNGKTEEPHKYSIELHKLGQGVLAEKNAEGAKDLEQVILTFTTDEQRASTFVNQILEIENILRG